MNKTRRDRLATLVAQLTDLAYQLEAIRDEEQSAFEDMPEGLQNSERGETIQANGEYLENATDQLTTALDAINEAINEADSVS